MIRHIGVYLYTCKGERDGETIAARQRRSKEEEAVPTR